MRLDTHVLVWAMPAPDLLSDRARETLAGATERCVRAAGLHEINCKAMLGKWPEVEALLSVDLEVRLRSGGFEGIPASGATMERAGRFAWAHRDPFDRIIVAAALARALPVVSKDGTPDDVPGAVLHGVW